MRRCRPWPAGCVVAHEQSSALGIAPGARQRCAEPSRQVDQVELSKNRPLVSAGRWWATHYCEVAQRLIFGNRSAKCGEDFHPSLIDYAGFWNSGAAKTVRMNSNCFAQLNS